jgi:hypothetical protein
MVGTSVVISCWTTCLSLLVTSWTNIGNWFPKEYSVYVGGITNCSSTKYTFLGI